MNRSTTVKKNQLQSNELEIEMLSLAHRVQKNIRKNYMKTVARSKELQAQGMSKEEAFEALMAE